MPIAHSNRWKLQVLSPVDLSLLWEAEAPTTKTLVLKWIEDTGNDYLDEAKVRRISLGKSKNKYIKLFKIGSYGSRGRENYDDSSESD